MLSISKVKRLRTLRWRVAAASALMYAVSACIVVVSVATLHENDIKTSEVPKDAGRRLLELIQAPISYDLATEQPLVPSAFKPWSDFKNPSSGRILKQEDGTVLFRFGDTWPMRGSSEYRSNCGKVIGKWFYTCTTVAKEWPNRKGEKYFLNYQVALKMDQYNEKIENFRRRLVAIAAGAILVFGAVVYVLIFRQLRPLTRITDRVNNLDPQSNKTVEYLDSDPQEICTLVEKINSYLKKLHHLRDTGDVARKKFKEQIMQQGEDLKRARQSSRFDAGLSHAVNRTLLSLQNIVLGVTPENERKTVENWFTVCCLMFSRRIDILVTSIKGPTEDSDAVHQVQKCVKFCQERYPDKTISSRGGEKTICVRVGEILLIGMIDDLLENALKAARKEVRITTEREGEMARIVVEDDGRGFESTDHGKLTSWDNIHLTGEKSGNGIGLPYLGDLTRIHGGSISFESSDKETGGLGGARVILELPLANTSRAEPTSDA